MAPLPPDLPVVDHHCHLSPHGEGVAAAVRFRKAGGTHLFLATQRYEPGVPVTLDDYDRQFRTTVELAAKLWTDAGVVAYPVIAPYPIDLLEAAKSLGVVGARELQFAALDLAGRMVESQQAVALGEVGRPHFPVPEGFGEAVDDVFRHALEVARDARCPAIVHCDDLDASGFRELASFAARSSFPPGKLVKHYARTFVRSEERAGVGASFLARRELIRACWEEPGPWFLETDFLDDPARPGAVLDLPTVPRRALAFWEGEPDRRERLRIPFVDSVKSVYGFAPAVGERRPA
ncbi:MAG: TatD family hydrolase [Thermoplasmata archaeon]|nr:TatD family hydrolase [Thermoplasmata archaeon]